MSSVDWVRGCCHKHWQQSWNPNFQVGWSHPFLPLTSNHWRTPKIVTIFWVYHLYFYTRLFLVPNIKFLHPLAAHGKWELLTNNFAGLLSKSHSATAFDMDHICNSPKKKSSPMEKKKKKWVLLIQQHSVPQANLQLKNLDIFLLNNPESCNPISITAAWKEINLNFGPMWYQNLLGFT